jgi:ATP-dependent helicase/DNAse subunit B
MAELLSRLEQGGDGLAASAFLFRPMPAPLRLSYSTISAFTRCPRCFYVTNVLGVRPPESDEIRIGNIAHAALEAFYRAWSSADADGLPLPGRTDLRRFGRAAFRAALDGQSTASEDDLAQLDAQLDVTFDLLHSTQAGAKPHVLEIERLITFPYEHAGHRHTFSAKIDRIDQIQESDTGASGGLRIIDYKSGQDWKSLTEPKADDLQMGIYAMALKSHFPDWDGTGEAQYWLLATGKRGVLDLATLKLDKIRAVINEAITNMLEGNFEKGKSCSGDCEFLGLD